MGTSEVFRRLCRFLRPQPPAAPDRAVDGWIREALVEDALEHHPPPGAWERLRKVINERKFRKYGMWVLDEPWRDPREGPPAPSLPRRNQLQFHTADLKREDYTWQQWQVREAVWSNMMPIFPAWVNW